MTEEPYSKREIDMFHTTILEKIGDLDEKITSGFAGVHSRQDESNHKVRKIILALVLAFGLIIGLGATNFQGVIRFFM